MMASRNGSRKSEEETLLSENDRMMEGLAGKVSRLKAAHSLQTFQSGIEQYLAFSSMLLIGGRVKIAVDIKEDANSQNKFLDGMDDQFGSAGGLLKGSAQRLTQVISHAGSDRKCMCYMILGLIATFFILYYGLGWIKT